MQKIVFFLTFFGFLLFFCPRMSLFVHFFDLFEGGVRVDLGGTQASMSEQSLYRSYVCPVIQHRGGKRMTKYVRGVFL